MGLSCGGDGLVSLQNVHHTEYTSFVAYALTQTHRHPLSYQLSPAIPATKAMATRTAEMEPFNIEAEMACLLDEMSDADLRSFADTLEDPVNDEQIELSIYICFLISKRTRSAEPLKEAILRTEGWIQEIASDHPDRGRRFHILHMISAKMSQQNPGINDLTALVTSLRGEIANMNHLYGLNDDDGMSLARILEVQRLSNLGVFYGRKFEDGGSMADLNLAVEYNEKALAAAPSTHPDRYCFLNNVGYILSRRYELTGKIADFNRAAELSRKAIDGAPLHHPDRGLWLRNLAYMLGTQFMRTGDIENLNQAIKISEDAVAATSLGDERLADLVSSLGI
jgi:tetratricopeptide (TPR) repeat protein